MNGYLEGQSFAWDSLSFVHRLRGEFQIAIDCCQQSLSVLPDVGPRSVLQRAETLTDLGDIHDAMGYLAAARRAWRDALQIFDDLHLPAYAEELRARRLRRGMASPQSHDLDAIRRPVRP